MLVQDAMRYQAMPVKTSKKQDLMVISEMRSTKILWYLAYRHRVGLLATTVIILVSYVAWDKVLHLFF